MTWAPIVKQPRGRTSDKDQASITPIKAAGVLTRRVRIYFPASVLKEFLYKKVNIAFDAENRLIGFLDNVTGFSIVIQKTGGGVLSFTHQKPLPVITERMTLTKVAADEGVVYRFPEVEHECPTVA